MVNKVRERSVGEEVLESLSPGQQVVKIVNEELTAVLGGGDHKLSQAGRPPTVVMLVGLQGSGKTHHGRPKLALHLKQRVQPPLLIAADLRRPAAPSSSSPTLGKQLDVSRVPGRRLVHGGEGGQGGRPEGPGNGGGVGPSWDTGRDGCT